MKKKQIQIEIGEEIFGVVFGIALFFIPNWVSMAEAGTILLQTGGILFGGFNLMRLLIK